MRFVNSIWKFQENLFDIINEHTVIQQGENRVSLLDLLERDTDIAFSFIKEEVCSNNYIEKQDFSLNRASSKEFPVLKIFNYSPWMKKLIRLIQESGNIAVNKQSTNEIARLIELVIVKNFIFSQIKNTITELNYEKYKKMLRSLLNDLSDKLYPSVLFEKNWGILFNFLFQDLSQDIGYLGQIIADLHKKNPFLPYLSEYSILQSCIEKNTLFTVPGSHDSALAQIILCSKEKATDIDFRNTFILSSLMTDDRHPLIMQMLEIVQKNIHDRKSKIHTYKIWMQSIEEVLVGIQKNNKFLKIMRSLYQDPTLHPNWFPILSVYAKHDITFFRCLVEEKHSILYAFIEKEDPSFMRNPSFSLIQACRDTFGHHYLDYKSDTVWSALNEHFTAEQIFQIFIDEQARSPLSPISLNHLLDILVLRKVSLLPIFEYLTNYLGIDAYESIFSKTTIVNQLPNTIQDFLAENYVKNIADDPNNTSNLYTLSKKLDKHTQKEELLGVKKIFKTYIQAEEERYKKVSEALLLDLMNEEEKAQQKALKKKNRKKGAKKKTADAIVAVPESPPELPSLDNDLLEKMEEPLEVESPVVVEEIPLAVSDTIVASLEPENIVIEPEEEKEQKDEAVASDKVSLPLSTLKKSMHFTYNPDATPWQAIEPPNLSPPLKTKHPIGGILNQFHRIYANIYKRKKQVPTFTCYGSSARILFEHRFSRDTLTEQVHDIDLYLHFAHPVSDADINRWSDKLTSCGATDLVYIDGRTTGGSYVQIRFHFDQTLIDLTLSSQALQKVFDLPTITFSLKQGPIAYFCIPPLFYNEKNQLQKVISFSPSFSYESLLDPTVLSFIWKQVAYLRAAKYTYDKSTLYEMTDLQDILLSQPHIIHESIALFFNKYFYKNPDFFFHQFHQDPIQIATLNPYLLLAVLQGQVMMPPVPLVPVPNNDHVIRRGLYQ